MPSDADLILSLTEKRSLSIYERCFGPDAKGEMESLLKAPEREANEIFTAALGCYAHFRFPLTLADFHSIVPGEIWDAHVSFQFTRFLGGFVPIYTGDGEWFFALLLGRRKYRYGSYRVYMATEYSPWLDDAREAPDWRPSMETPILRYTLCHPYLHGELHDSSGIYVFGALRRRGNSG